MLEPCTYSFPPEAEAFTRLQYTAWNEAINAAAAAERRKITGQAIALGVVCFLSVFAFLIAAHSGLTRAERAYQMEARV